MPARRQSLALALCVALFAACDKRPPAKAADVDGATRGGAALQATAAPVEPVAPPLPTAGSIHYVERILGDAEPDEALPMIVAIHGLGDDPENFAHLFDAFPERARLILPRGIDEYADGGWSWFPIRAGDRNVEALAGGIKTSADRLAEALAVLEKARPTRGTPIVTGFSQGGMLAFTLAVHHPNVTGSAVPVGGWLPPPLWPEKKANLPYPAIVALHGTADTAVRYETTRESIDHLNKVGIAVELKSYDGVPHALSTEIRRDLQDALVDAVRKAAGAL
jgi:phospholipase/carboxylesterase